MKSADTTRRRFMTTAAAGLISTPALVKAQEPTASDITRNTSSFRVDSWQDHFESLRNGAILCDIDSRAVQFWSEDESIYKLYPSSVPLSEELTRR